MTDGGVTKPKFFYAHNLLGTSSITGLNIEVGQTLPSDRRKLWSLSRILSKKNAESKLTSSTEHSCAMLLR